MKENQTMIKIDKVDRDLLREVQVIIQREQGIKLPLGKVASFLAKLYKAKTSERSIINEA